MGQEWPAILGGRHDPGCLSDLQTMTYDRFLLTSSIGRKIGPFVQQWVRGIWGQVVPTKGLANNVARNCCLPTPTVEMTTSSRKDGQKSRNTSQLRSAASTELFLHGAPLPTQQFQIRSAGGRFRPLPIWPGRSTILLVARKWANVWAGASGARFPRAERSSRSWRGRFAVVSWNPHLQQSRIVP